MIYSLINISSQQLIDEVFYDTDFSNDNGFLSGVEKFMKFCNRFFFNIDKNEYLNKENNDKFIFYYLCYDTNNISKDKKQEIKNILKKIKPLATNLKSTWKNLIESLKNSKAQNIINLSEDFNKNYDEYTSNSEKYKDKTKLDYLLDRNEENFFKVFENIGFNSRDEYNKLSDENKNRLNTYDLQFIYNFFYFLKQQQHAIKKDKKQYQGNLKDCFNFEENFLGQFLSKRENLQEVEKELGRDVLEICLEQFDFDVSYDGEEVLEVKLPKDLIDKEKLEKAETLLENFNKINNPIIESIKEEKRIKEKSEHYNLFYSSMNQTFSKNQINRIGKFLKLVGNLNYVDETIEKGRNLKSETIKKIKEMETEHRKAEIAEKEQELKEIESEQKKKQEMLDEIKNIDDNKKRDASVKMKEIFKIYDQKIKEQKEIIEKLKDLKENQDSLSYMEHNIPKELEEDKELQKLNLEFENLLKEEKKMVENEPKNEGKNKFDEVNKEKKLIVILLKKNEKEGEMFKELKETANNKALTEEAKKILSNTQDKINKIIKIYDKKIKEEEERIAKQQDPNKYQNLSNDEMENIVLKELEEDKELQKLNLEFQQNIQDLREKIKTNIPDTGSSSGEGNDESRKTPEEDKNKGDKDKPFYKNPLVHFILLIILGALLWFIFKKKEIKEQEHNLKEIENKNKEEEIILDH